LQARPEQVDAGISYVRDEVMPAMERMDGAVGLSMLVDRKTGRCIVTSSWLSEDAMHNSNRELTPMRERAGELMGGTPQVDEWEIAVLHREHQAPPGACTRVVWNQIDASRVDDVLEMYRSTVLPSLEELDGFCSASMMINRRTGKGVGAATFDSRGALERTRERAAQLRQNATDRVGLTFLDVAEFELALAHLRVPETV
jgi:quinol monooxygenase YgiN